MVSLRKAPSSRPFFKRRSTIAASVCLLIGIFLYFYTVADNSSSAASSAASSSSSNSNDDNVFSPTPPPPTSNDHDSSSSSSSPSSSSSSSSSSDFFSSPSFPPPPSLPLFVSPSFYQLTLSVNPSVSLSSASPLITGIVRIHFDVRHLDLDELTLHAGPSVRVYDALLSDPSSNNQVYPASERRHDNATSLLHLRFRELRPLLEQQKISFVLQLRFATSASLLAAQPPRGLARVPAADASHSLFSLFNGQNARYVFPCFDEMGLGWRANFSVSVRAPLAYDNILSSAGELSRRQVTAADDGNDEGEGDDNDPLSTAIPPSTASLEVKFHNSVRIAPSQLALFVAPADASNDSTSAAPDPKILPRIQLRVFDAGGPRISMTGFARVKARQVIESLEDQLASHFPLGKLDLVAVPGLPRLVARAAQGVGVVMMPERDLLVHFSHSSAADKRHVALRVARAVASCFFAGQPLLGINSGALFGPDAEIIDALVAMHAYDAVTDIYDTDAGIAHERGWLVSHFRQEQRRQALLDATQPPPPSLSSPLSPRYYRFFEQQRPLPGLLQSLVMLRHSKELGEDKWRSACSHLVAEAWEAADGSALTAESFYQALFVVTKHESDELGFRTFQDALPRLPTIALVSVGVDADNAVIDENTGFVNDIRVVLEDGDDGDVDEEGGAHGSSSSPPHWPWIPFPFQSAGSASRSELGIGLSATQQLPSSVVGSDPEKGDAFVPDIDRSGAYRVRLDPLLLHATLERIRKHGVGSSRNGSELRPVDFAALLDDLIHLDERDASLQAQRFALVFDPLLSVGVTNSSSEIVWRRAISFLAQSIELSKLLDSDGDAPAPSLTDSLRLFAQRLLDHISMLFSPPSDDSDEMASGQNLRNDLPQDDFSVQVLSEEALRFATLVGHPAARNLSVHCWLSWRAHEPCIDSVFVSPDYILPNMHAGVALGYALDETVEPAAALDDLSRAYKESIHAAEQHRLLSAIALASARVGGDDAVAALVAFVRGAAQCDQLDLFNALGSVSRETALLGLRLLDDLAPPSSSPALLLQRRNADDNDELSLFFRRLLLEPLLPFLVQADLSESLSDLLLPRMQAQLHANENLISKLTILEKSNKNVLF